MQVSHYFIHNHNTPMQVRLQSAKFTLLDCDSPHEFPHQVIFKFNRSDLIILLLVQKRLKLSYLACIGLNNLYTAKSWAIQ